MTFWTNGKKYSYCPIRKLQYENWIDKTGEG